MLAQTSSKDPSIGAYPSPLRLIVGTILHTVALPGSLVVGVPSRLLDAANGGSGAVGLVQRAAGIVSIVAGVVVLGVCTWDFVRSGKGTPNPLDPPRILVRQRLYRYVRNPFYVAVVMILVGESLAFAAPVLVVYAASVWLILQGIVVFYEEPTLRRGFGAPYEAYCRDVPRWVPRLRAR